MALRKVEEAAPIFGNPESAFDRDLVLRLRQVFLQYGWTINQLIDLVEAGTGAAAVIPKGAKTKGTVALPGTDTWTQVPPSGSVPAADYVLTVAVLPEDGEIRFSFIGGAAPPNPSSTGLPPLGYYNRLLMEGGEAVFFSSTNSADVVRWEAQEIE